MAFFTNLSFLFILDFIHVFIFSAYFPFCCIQSLQIVLARKYLFRKDACFVLFDSPLIQLNSHHL